jgi:hypothetical protein
MMGDAAVAEIKNCPRKAWRYDASGTSKIGA